MERSASARRLSREGLAPPVSRSRRRQVTPRPLRSATDGSRAEQRPVEAIRLRRSGVGTIGARGVLLHYRIGGTKGAKPPARRLRPSQSRPRSGKEMDSEPAATTKWSSVRMSTSASACFSAAVISVANDRKSGAVRVMCAPSCARKRADHRRRRAPTSVGFW